MELDMFGRSPLHHAAAENDLAEAKRLLDAGSHPNLRDRDGFTPLHFAAEYNAVDVATALLDAGANVDPVNRYGNTPLWTATFNSRGNGAMIGLLRQHGADPCHRNHADATPIDLARGIANYDVARFFADLPPCPPSNRPRPVRLPGFE